MGISELYIVKRDGKRKAFSVEKIKRAVRKAFLSVGSYATDDDITSILSRVHVSDGMSVEEIQNQVEVALMAERYFAVAKSYMLYRQKHTEEREDREKLEFLINYCDASNPATGSKYDANANVENKNIAMLVGEHHKTRREVAFYADKLCISPVYLTKVVQEVNGQSAHEMIADYVVIEIKTLLRDARLDIKAVARRAGFANQSSLSRFFRLHTGMSPTEYRRTIHVTR